MDLAVIQNKIYHIRGMQVMLDRDLAQFYDIDTRSLKQAVNRNLQRFPSDFMFILTDQEIDSLVSQSVIPSKKHFGGALPYVFTEQGVAILSSVLKSPKSVRTHITIIRAFVAMRRFLASNAQVFYRLDTIEHKQLDYDTKFEKIFDAIEAKQITPKQGIFFDGQVFDAHIFISQLILEAKKSIVLIDNYIDERVLALFSNTSVSVTIYTSTILPSLRVGLEKYNSQYSPIILKEFKNSHDRFMIIDSTTVYHIGASLKDLGKRWFAFSRFDIDALDILERLR